MGARVHSGRCLCGRVRLEAEGDPLWVVHCHCGSCRRSTGAAVTTYVAFPAARVRITGERRIHASSPGVRRAFCGRCGTPLSYEADRYAGEIHFHISVMDAPHAFSPQRHVFHDERLPWMELQDDLPRYPGPGEGQPSSRGTERRSVK